MKKSGIILGLFLLFTVSTFAQKADKKMPEMDKMEKEMDKAFEQLKESMSSFQEMFKNIEVPEAPNMEEFDFDQDLLGKDGNIEFSKMFEMMSKSMDQLSSMDWSGIQDMFGEISKMLPEDGPSFEIKPDQIKEKKKNKTRKF